MKKWIFFALGGLISGIITYYALPYLYSILKNTYDQTLLQNALSSKLSRSKISEVGVNETFLVSYAYDEHEPRFYSKYNAKKDESIFDL